MAGLGTIFLQLNSARNRAKDEAYSRALDQQRIQQEGQYQQGELDVQRQEQERLTQQQAAQNRLNGLDANGNPLPPLQVPAGDQQLFPNNKGKAPLPIDPRYWAQAAAHNQTLAQVADSQGRPDLAATYAQRARDATLMGSSIASGVYTAGAKTNETNSQASYNTARTSFTNSWRERLKMQLDARLKQIQATSAGAYQRAAMAASRAQASANAAMSRLQYSTEAREAISLGTALNAANGQSDRQAFEAAKSQYDVAAKQWEADYRTYSAGGTPPAEFNPAQPPTFVMPQAAPSATETTVPITIVMPDGTTRQTQAPVINRGGARSTRSAASRGGGTGAQQRKFVLDARAGGQNERWIRTEMQKRGATEPEIDKAMAPSPGAAPPAGGGF